MFSKLVIMNTGLPSPVLDFNDDNGDPVVGPASILTKLQKVIEKIQTQIIHFSRNSIVPSLYPVEIPGTTDRDKIACRTSLWNLSEEAQCRPCCGCRL